MADSERAGEVEESGAERAAWGGVEERVRDRTEAGEKE